MKTLAEIRRMLAEHKAELRERFGVARLAVFGSYARGDATPLSDVDILVAFERPIGWEIVDLRDYLEALLGVPVDLITEAALQRKPRLWESVQEEIIHV
ncbi:nucleotidyltransferase family protein [Thermoflexus sp.]|uniref:nucleotidyltransferase family protein n=1 Tax=Thermoflexus sp. TaxID=1969742 RepID=UPI001767F4E6|nr:nucleotidyltransferase family protein [Thermoflexus sp.]